MSTEDEKSVPLEVTLHPDHKEIITKVLNDCEYGQVITFDEFASWLSRDMKNANDVRIVKNAISRARDSLESQGKGLKSYYNGGYIVVHPNNYEDFIMGKVEKKVRLEKRIVNAAVNAPLDKMNDGARIGMERTTGLIVQSVAQSVASLNTLKLGRQGISINRAHKNQIEIKSKEEEENGNEE